MGVENQETPLDRLNTEALKSCAISGEPFETRYDNVTEKWYAINCVVKDGKAYNTKNLADKALEVVDEDDLEVDETLSRSNSNPVPELHPTEVIELDPAPPPPSKKAKTPDPLD